MAVKKEATPIVHPVLGMVFAIPFPGIGMVFHGQFRKGLSCILTQIVIWIVLFALCAVLVGIPLLPIFFIFVLIQIVELEITGVRMMKGEPIHTHQYSIPFLGYFLLPPILDWRGDETQPLIDM